MKSKFPLVVAILIGIVALFSIKSYIDKEKQRVREQLKGEPVVAASTDIPAGAELSMQMIVPKEVPRQFIPAQAIRGSDEVKQILGRKTRIAVKAGQIILWTDLASEVRGGLSTIIPAGEGAFSVTIAKGIKTGLIQPSDHIDIIGSFAMPKPTQPVPQATAATWRQGSDMVNVVLLQNVTVLAVGDAFGGASRSGGTGAELTLALTLQEAQLLMFASQHGDLGAMLRREGATEVKPHTELPRVTFEEIEKIIGDLEGRRNLRMIEVQKGAKSESVPILNPQPDKGGQP